MLPSYDKICILMPNFIYSNLHYGSFVVKLVLKYALHAQALSPTGSNWNVIYLHNGLWPKNLIKEKFDRNKINR